MGFFLGGHANKKKKTKQKKNPLKLQFCVFLNKRWKYRRFMPSPNSV
jgi:hypothetical protein